MRSRLRAQRLQLFFCLRENLTKLRFFKRQAVDIGFGGQSLTGKLGGFAVELDVIGQQARTLDAQPFDLAGEFFAGAR